MESLKSKKFDKLKEQQLNDLISYGGVDKWGFTQSLLIKMTGTGSLSVSDNTVDYKIKGKGHTPG